VKRQYIKWLIGLISLALIGLISIQFYWIRNSVALRNAQFSFSVRTALSEIAARLETEDAVRRQRKNKGVGQLSSLPDSLLISAGAQSRDTLVSTDPSGLKVLSERISGRVQTASAQGAAVNWKGTGTGADTSALLSASGVNRPSLAIIEELLSGYLPLGWAVPVEQRIDRFVLDSLLHAQLTERGIHTPYEFAVFNTYEEAVLSSTEQSDLLALLADQGYRVRLFPGDLFQQANYLKVYFPRQRGYLIETMWEMLVTAAIFILIIIIAFAYTIRTIVLQKKISEIKNDFINNMTHELKTPIATISLACEALSDPDISLGEDRTRNYMRMIRDENKRLGVLVENVLRSAVLDRGEVVVRPETINMHDLIDEVIQNIGIQVNRKGGIVSRRFEAHDAVVAADRIHLTNVIYNLIDNALKYTPDRPEIEVSTHSKGNCLVVSVKDNGIGIPREHQKKIFDKLYRVPTGNIHNVKGFGLGLSYVKNIMDKHHGKITLQSEINKGSTFNLFIPHRYEIQE
jgi:two-component system phosphate regulon sensor histidine kinase PhoR